jgi:transcriptional regulator with XRE-family HTH domain
MSTRLGNYLRLYRRRSTFTQGELAFLLGYRTDSIVSRFERQGRRIPLSIAFAYHLIFGGDPKEIFPALFEQVEDGVVRRMYELHERLQGARPSQRTAAKLQLLERALARNINNPQQQEI